MRYSTKKKHYNINPKFPESWQKLESKLHWRSYELLPPDFVLLYSIYASLITKISTLITLNSKNSVQSLILTRNKVMVFFGSRDQDSAQYQLDGLLFQRVSSRQDQSDLYVMSDGCVGMVLAKQFEVCSLQSDVDLDVLSKKRKSKEYIQPETN